MDDKIDLLEQQSNKILEKLNRIHAFLTVILKSVEEEEISPMLEYIASEIKTTSTLADLHNMEITRIKYQIIKY